MEKDFNKQYKAMQGSGTDPLRSASRAGAKAMTTKGIGEMRKKKPINRTAASGKPTTKKNFQ